MLRRGCCAARSQAAQGPCPQDCPTLSQHQQELPGQSWPESPQNKAQPLTAPRFWEDSMATGLKEGTGPHKMPRGEQHIPASAAALQVCEPLADAETAPVSLPASAGCQQKAGPWILPMKASESSAPCSARQGK